MALNDKFTMPIIRSAATQVDKGVTPFRIQLVLQGGGAKLAAHLAAMEAVEELVADKTIEVTRIAGTSAGAMIGCLYAASGATGRTISDIAVELFDGGKGRALFRKVRTWKLTAFFRLLCGKPLWKPHHLDAWLRAKFRADAHGSTKELRMRDLRPNVTVVTTDLTSVEGKAIAGDGEYVHDVVMKSAGLPYLLSKWGATGPVFVDGGICENLPAGELEDTESDGSIIAFTFPPDLEKNPRNYLKFAKGLLLSAMENSEHRAKMSLAQGRVHEIKTTLTTFDFDRAFSKEFRSDNTGEYYRLKEAAASFLRGFVEEQKRKQEEQTVQVNQKWWTDENPLVQELLVKMGRIYDRQHRVSLRHHHVVFEVAAEQWSDKNVACPVYHRFEFSSEKEPIFGIEVSMVSLSQDGLLADTDISVYDAHNQPRAFEEYPLRDPNAPDRRGLVIFFLPPLPPEEHFFIAINEKAKLQDADFKDLVYRTDRLGDYAVERIDLVLHIPKESRVALSKHDESPDGQFKDFESTKSLKIKGLKAIGWTGAQVKLKKGQPFGVFINRK